jgi:hypothetical protein
MLTQITEANMYGFRDGFKEKERDEERKKENVHASIVY